MKVGELKKILENFNPDMEVFVSPVIEMEVLGNDTEKPTTTMTPTPMERYEVSTIVEAGDVGNKGVHNMHLLLGFDYSVNYGIQTEEDDQTDDFIN